MHKFGIGLFNSRWLFRHVLAKLQKASLGFDRQDRRPGEGGRRERMRERKMCVRMCERQTAPGGGTERDRMGENAREGGRAGRTERQEQRQARELHAPTDNLGKLSLHFAFLVLRVIYRRQRHGWPISTVFAVVDKRTVSMPVYKKFSSLFAISVRKKLRSRCLLADFDTAENSGCAGNKRSCPYLF